MTDRSDDPDLTSRRIAQAQGDSPVFIPLDEMRQDPSYPPDLAIIDHYRLAMQNSRIKKGTSDLEETTRHLMSSIAGCPITRAEAAALIISLLLEPYGTRIRKLHRTMYGESQGAFVRSIMPDPEWLHEQAGR